MFLGIESSCDECSASVVEFLEESRPVVRSLRTFSQVKLHQPYGGVVPEVASRNHLEVINEVLFSALKDAGIKMDELSAVAVTNRPGLVGSLLVGVSAAKAFAYLANKSLVPVHHLEGHAVSVFLNQKLSIEYPLLLAVVSGGHTNLYRVEGPPGSWPIDFLRKSLIGRSRDDAAGEAFDKTAKLLGFSYPGGIWLDKMSENGKIDAFRFPRPVSQQKESYDFSFSGLKTAVALEVERLRKSGRLQECVPDLCASIQEAIVDTLLGKIGLAVRDLKCRSLAIVGGVAANRRLRARLEAEWKGMGLLAPPVFPEMQYCTDNAAMIAAAGGFRYLQGHFMRVEDYLTLNARATAEV